MTVVVCELDEAEAWHLRAGGREVAKRSVEQVDVGCRDGSRQVRCLLDRPQLRRWRSDDAPGSPVALLGASVLAQHQQQGASQEGTGSGQPGHDPGGRLEAAVDGLRPDIATVRSS